MFGGSFEFPGNYEEFEEKVRNGLFVFGGHHESEGGICVGSSGKNISCSQHDAGVVEVAGMFRELADAEEGLSEKA